MEVAYGRISQSKILESVLHSDAERIKESIEMIDPNAFDMAVETILNAKRITILWESVVAHHLQDFLHFT